ncbi:MAG TPA: LLM class flavin-dependent oxidoreductase [Gammaproteobacteria bacterium]|nr:LLM class flavin-dependent oxidoreductase [Gammaproteobacteria bacterium]
MKFGIFDHMDSNGATLGKQFAERLALIEAYDRLGFYAYHLAEHHGTPLGLAPSPGIFMAAVAQRTSRLRFGPLVYTLPLYHPVRLIEEICMLDQMSDGRFELGVGRGVSPIEVGFYGVDAEAGPRQFPEALRLIKQGLTSDELTFEGEFYRFERVPMLLEPVQKPHPPLWYGVGTPKATYWAAFEGANAVTLGSTTASHAVVEAYQAAWAGFGRSLEALPLLGIQRLVVLAPSEAAAVRSAERAYRVWLRHMRWLWDRRGVPFTLPLPAEIGSWLDAGGAFAGTPSGFRKFVADQVAATGASYFVCDLAFGDLSYDFGDLSYDESAQTTELVGREVLPSFAV